MPVPSARSRCRALAAACLAPLGIVALLTTGCAGVRTAPPWQEPLGYRAGDVFLYNPVTGAWRFELMNKTTGGFTRDELEALCAGLLVSHDPPLGSDRFEMWLAENADRLGRRYQSELARNFRG